MTQPAEAPGPWAWEELGDDGQWWPQQGPERPAESDRVRNVLSLHASGGIYAPGAIATNYVYPVQPLRYYAARGLGFPVALMVEGLEITIDKDGMVAGDPALLLGRCRDDNPEHTAIIAICRLALRAAAATTAPSAKTEGA